MDIPDGQATEIEHAIHVYFKWTFRNSLYALMMAARRFRYMIMTIVAVCPQTNFHGVFFSLKQESSKMKKKSKWIFNISTAQRAMSIQIDVIQIDSL